MGRREQERHLNKTGHALKAAANWAGVTSGYYPTWDDTKKGFVPAAGSSGGVAPADASYVVVGSNPTLTAERVLAAGAGVLLTDGGAGAALTASMGFASETRGDLAARGATQWQRLALGTAGRALVAGAQDPAWTEVQVLHGFEDTSATLAYDAGTRVLTVTKVGGIPYWREGVRYVLATPQTFPAHANARGVYHLFIDAAGVLTASTSPPNLLTEVPVAAVVHDTTGPKGLLLEERHGYRRNRAWHASAHMTLGTQREPSGHVVGDYTVDTDTLAGVQISVGAGDVWDEDIETACSALAAAGPYVVAWRTGATGEWTWTTTRTLPWEAVGGWPVANTYAAGSWGQAALGNLQFGVMYVLRLPGVAAGAQTLLVPGQAIYTSLAAAQAARPESMQWGTMPPEFVVVARYILAARTAYAADTEQTQIREVTYLYGSRSALVAGTAGAHASLTGLALLDSGHTGTASRVWGSSAAGAAAELAIGQEQVLTLRNGALTSVRRPLREAFERRMHWIANPHAATVNCSDTAPLATALGALTLNVQNTGPFITTLSGAVIGNSAGYYQASNLCRLGQGCILRFKFYTGATTDVTYWVGLWKPAAALPTQAAAYPQEHAALRFVAGVDAQWVLSTGDAAAGQTVSGNIRAIAASTEYWIELDSSVPGEVTARFYDASYNLLASSTATLTLPVAGSNMAWMLMCITQVAGAKSLHFGIVDMESL